MHEAWGQATQSRHMPYLLLSAAQRRHATALRVAWWADRHNGPVFGFLSLGPHTAFREVGKQTKACQYTRLPALLSLHLLDCPSFMLLSSLPAPCPSTVAWGAHMHRYPAQAQAVRCSSFRLTDLLSVACSSIKDCPGRSCSGAETLCSSVVVFTRRRQQQLPTCCCPNESTVTVPRLQQTTAGD